MKLHINELIPSAAGLTANSAISQPTNMNISIPPTGTHPLRHRLGIFFQWTAALVQIFALLYTFVLRTIHLRWGATNAEVNMTLPGDKLVPHPSIVGQSTRAITINAPASAIWPWLVQLGQGRGGLYSYDWLENLVGCDIHSADSVISEFQEIKVGDTVRLYKDGSGPPPYIVARVEPERALVLGQHMEGLPAAAETGWGGSWAFVLDPIDENTTRLIVRSRSVAWTGDFIVEPMQFLMEQKMMRGIKERAERSFATDAPAI